MIQKTETLSPKTAAAELGSSEGTVRRACRDNPGFAWRVNSAYFIPRAHVERLKLGETAAEIAADVQARARGAAAAA